MTKTQYYNSTVIMRQALDYAADLNLYLENPFKYVKSTASECFGRLKKTRMQRRSIRQPKNAQPELVWKDYYSHNCTYDLCTAGNSIPAPGLRIGELCAVRYEDAKARIRDLSKWYVQQRQKTAEHAKTDCGDR